MCIRDREHAVHITFKGFRLSWRTIKDIYAVGIPSIIMQSIGSLLIMGLNGILKGFSDTATAVLGVYYKLQSFAVSYTHLDVYKRQQWARWGEDDWRLPPTYTKN